MGKGFAILRDSFRETLDYKTFWILLIISTILILFCFSVSFTELSPQEALQDIAKGFNVVRPFPPVTPDKVTYDVTFAVDEVTRDDEGGYAFRLTVTPASEFHRVIRHQQALSRKKIKNLRDEVPDIDRPVDPDGQESFLKSRLRGEMMKQIEIKPVEAETGTAAYRVRLEPWNDWSLGGAHEAHYLFGAISHRTGEGGGAGVVTIIQIILTNFFASFFGVPIAIIFTAFFVPDMLRKGRVDTLISRPITRTSLLCWKFTGGLLYVFLNAAYLVGGCWFALALRSGHWDASFLWVIVTLTGSFAVVYAFSTWLSVLTRSAVVSLLCTLGMWAFAWVAGLVRRLTETANIPDGLRSTIGALHAVLPKSYDLYELNTYLIGQSNFGSQMMAAAPNAKEPEWALILISSGAFLALFLSLSCVSFTRKDY